MDQFIETFLHSLRDLGPLVVVIVGLGGGFVWQLWKELRHTRDTLYATFEARIADGAVYQEALKESISALVKMESTLSSLANEVGSLRRSENRYEDSVQRGGR